jgi:hypothetical protein
MFFRIQRGAAQFRTETWSVARDLRTVAAGIGHVPRQRRYPMTLCSNLETCQRKVPFKDSVQVRRRTGRRSLCRIVGSSFSTCSARFFGTLTDNSSKRSFCLSSVSRVRRMVFNHSLCLRKKDKEVYREPCG